MRKLLILLLIALWTLIPTMTIQADLTSLEATYDFESTDSYYHQNSLGDDLNHTQPTLNGPGWSDEPFTAE